MVPAHRTQAERSPHPEQHGRGAFEHFGAFNSHSSSLRRLHLSEKIENGQ